ncbi:MAG: gliding motility-associated C-terminal domain-containing protein [Flavobacteriales bacterium]|nr:gliding motility-associated C-terminal domain-containing protein [Flavobacteriales bacterium]MCW8911992.1 gliding motility-associated C-terminal domain-containing protein [Flavobacteriales bacterium]MCW8940639.1 gliding motility-associated C-terminal domain-containing protein [Flavobacteriales bacterium]MCW8968704.1 gliding motility-associated C-terminal domain-containing protein [Flavobacteriales bacterium]MCW8990414.1 gliding motility-associated C-terminal domain-containing protein [Flavob
MKKSILSILIFSCLFFLNAFQNNNLNAQTATTTITYGGFQACGGCTVCGADYWCFNTVSSWCGNTAACGTQNFMDPVPPGNIVTNIAISYYSAECQGGSLTATINGNAFPTVNEGNSGCACSNNPCAVSATTGQTFPCGVPGYNYGASNSFQMCTGAGVCINRAVLTMTYVPSNQATPATQPGAITGNSNVCTGVASTFSIPPVANAAGYTWTVPAGWTINSGQGTTSITATPGSTGNICVTANNLCGTSAPRCFAVTVSNPSVAPTSATATPNPICVGSTTNLTANGGSLGTGASWQWYSGSCGGTSVGSGSTITVSPGTTTTYFVRAEGTCNNTTCQSVTVTVNPVVNPAWTNPSPICAAAGSINLNNLITGTTGGTWSGTGVTGTNFNPASGTQSVTYTVGSAPCTQTLTQTITVIPDVNPAWTNPSPICAAAGTINLNNLITGTTGGTWSGIGVTGTSFNPSSGSQSVTYTVGTAPCQETQTHTINVLPDVNPSWTNPSPVCAAGGNINLDNLVTGTTGGTWSGTGVTGNMFDPNSGSQSVTYTVGTAPCQETQTHTINVSAFDASWTNPGPMCESATPIDLSTLVTGSSGGSFSGTGVTGNNFDPTGLGGTNVSITYTVGAAPCTETLVHSVVINADDDASFNYSSTTFCEADNNPIPTITGTNGGTFTISPSGTINATTGEIDITLTGIGSYTIYYNTTSAGNACPSVDSVQITINPQNTISINPVNPICLNDTLNLSANTTGTGTVTWYADAAGTIIIGIGNPLTYVPTSGGSVTIYANNVGSCSSEIDSVTITVNFVDAVINATPVTGSSPLDVFFGNGSTGATNYFWNFGNGSTDTIFEPTHTYTNPGSFTATLIITNGVCWDTATVIIEVFDESSILIPTIFTPNGDGSNDFFRVDGVNLKHVEGEIYNRWGQKMFSWDNVNGMWDGKTLSGADAADGTYYFIIRAEGIDGKEYFQKGTLTLIR